MARPVTLFTAQWADLPFATMCQKLGAWGYDGAEIACWGEHMDPRKGAEDPSPGSPSTTPSGADDHRSSSAMLCGG